MTCPWSFFTYDPSPSHSHSHDHTVPWCTEQNNKMMSPQLSCLCGLEREVYNVAQAQSTCEFSIIKGERKNPRANGFFVENRNESWNSFRVKGQMSDRHLANSIDNLVVLRRTSMLFHEAMQGICSLTKIYRTAGWLETRARMRDRRKGEIEPGSRNRMRGNKRLAAR
jgi:hypothetical protein